MGDVEIDALDYDPVSLKEPKELHEWKWLRIPRQWLDYLTHEAVLKVDGRDQACGLCVWQLLILGFLFYTAYLFYSEAQQRKVPAQSVSLITEGPLMRHLERLPYIAVCPVLSGPLDHESVLATAPVSNGVSVKSEVRAYSFGWSDAGPHNEQLDVQEVDLDAYSVKLPADAACPIASFCDVILDGERYAQSGSPGFQKLSVKERVLSFTVSVAIQHPAAIQDQSKLWSSMELVLVPAWGLNDLCSLNTSFGRGGDDVTYEVSYRLGLEELSKSYSAEYMADRIGLQLRRTAKLGNFRLLGHSRPRTELSYEILPIGRTLVSTALWPPAKDDNSGDMATRRFVRAVDINTSPYIIDRAEIEPVNLGETIGTALGMWAIFVLLFKLTFPSRPSGYRRVIKAMRPLSMRLMPRSISQQLRDFEASLRAPAEPDESPPRPATGGKGGDDAPKDGGGGQPAKDGSSQPAKESGGHVAKESSGDTAKESGGDTAKDGGSKAAKWGKRRRAKGGSAGDDMTQCLRLDMMLPKKLERLSSSLSSSLEELAGEAAHIELPPIDDRVKHLEGVVKVLTLLQRRRMRVERLSQAVRMATLRTQGEEDGLQWHDSREDELDDAMSFASLSTVSEEDQHGEESDDEKYEDEDYGFGGDAFTRVIFEDDYDYDGGEEGSEDELRSTGYARTRSEGAFQGKEEEEDGEDDDEVDSFASAHMAEDEKQEEKEEEPGGTRLFTRLVFDDDSLAEHGHRGSGLTSEWGPRGELGPDTLTRLDSGEVDEAEAEIVRKILQGKLAHDDDDEEEGQLGGLTRLSSEDAEEKEEERWRGGHLPQESMASFNLSRLSTEGGGEDEQQEGPWRKAAYAPLAGVEEEMGSMGLNRLPRESGGEGGYEADWGLGYVQLPTGEEGIGSFGLSRLSIQGGDEGEEEHGAQWRDRGGYAHVEEQMGSFGPTRLSSVDEDDEVGGLERLGIHRLSTAGEEGEVGEGGLGPTCFASVGEEEGDRLGLGRLPTAGEEQRMGGWDSLAATQLQIIEEEEEEEGVGGFGPHDVQVDGVCGLSAIRLSTVVEEEREEGATSGVSRLTSEDYEEPRRRTSYLRMPAWVLRGGAARQDPARTPTAHLTDDDDSEQQQSRRGR